jgi:hypothetical protein
LASVLDAEAIDAVGRSRAPPTHGTRRAQRAAAVSIGLAAVFDTVDTARLGLTGVRSGLTGVRSGRLWFWVTRKSEQHADGQRAQSRTKGARQHRESSNTGSATTAGAKYIATKQCLSTNSRQRGEWTVIREPKLRTLRRPQLILGTMLAVALVSGCGKPTVKISCGEGTIEQNGLCVLAQAPLTCGRVRPDPEIVMVAAAVRWLDQPAAAQSAAIGDPVEAHLDEVVEHTVRKCYA